MKDLIPEIVKIVKKRQETKDIASLWVEGGKLLSSEPGQFIMVSLFGLEEAPLSIAGREGDLIILTVKDAGSLTNELLSLAPGSEIGIRGPYGRGFPLDQVKGKPLILIAGGIGLPPIWSVLESLPTPIKETYLLYGAKREEEIIYKEELAAKKDVKILQTVDSPSKGWKGHVGFVHNLLDLLKDDTFKNALVFACGPEVMYRPLLEALKAKGLPDTRTYLSFERQMRCGIGRCGHCYQGRKLVCTDGPVFRGDEAKQVGFLDN